MLLSAIRDFREDGASHAMPSVLPSQIMAAISDLFGSSPNDLDSGTVGHWRRSEVRTLLRLLDQVPGDLIALSFHDYLEF